MLSRFEQEYWPFSQKRVTEKLSAGKTREQIVADAENAVKMHRGNWRLISARLDFMTLEMPDSITVLPYRTASSITADMGGGTGALKNMGALDMGFKEEELQPLVTAWRNSNPNIVKFWWAVDRAVMKAITERTTTETHGLTFTCRSGMLFITLPSGRKLAYVKPRIGMNQFGGRECYL